MKLTHKQVFALFARWRSEMGISILNTGPETWREFLNMEEHFQCEHCRLYGDAQEVANIIFVDEEDRELYDAYYCDDDDLGCYSAMKAEWELLSKQELI